MDPAIAYQDIPNIQQIKDSMRASWMAGDFGVVARTISSGAERFIGRLSIPKGARVLDVACGTGNLALPIARQGALVTGVDIATNLLAQARERATTEGLDVAFDEGDAEQLPYEEASFDIAVTMFGAMFAPRPALVASELARVLKPGGLLAMANWTPGSFSGQMFKMSANHLPPPPGVPPPVLWGDEEIVRERLSPYFTDIRTEIVPIDFEMATNAAGAVSFFSKYFGPTKVAFTRLDELGKTALAADLEWLWAGANVSPHPEHNILVHNQYLQVKATRKG